MTEASSKSDEVQTAKDWEKEGTRRKLVGSLQPDEQEEHCQSYCC